jgi:hypothetical protein
MHNWMIVATHLSRRYIAVVEHCVMVLVVALEVMTIGRAAAAAAIDIHVTQYPCNT